MTDQEADRAAAEAYARGTTYSGSTTENEFAFLAGCAHVRLQCKQNANPGNDSANTVSADPPQKRRAVRVSGGFKSQ